MRTGCAFVLAYLFSAQLFVVASPVPFSIPRTERTTHVTTLDHDAGNDETPSTGPSGDTHGAWTKRALPITVGADSKIVKAVADNKHALEIASYVGIAGILAITAYHFLGFDGSWKDPPPAPAPAGPTSSSTSPAPSTKATSAVQPPPSATRAL